MDCTCYMNSHEYQVTFVKMWLLALLAGLLIAVSATGEEIPEDSDSDEDLYTSISVEDYENTQGWVISLLPNSAHLDCISLISKSNCH